VRIASLPIGLLLLGTCLLLTGCGDDDADLARGGVHEADAPAADLPRACGVKTVDLRAAPHTLPGVYWGQEIWLSWREAKYAGKAFGFRYPRSRDEALAKARDLCRQVHGGADPGKLARRWSNGDFGIADGLCVVPEPAHRTQPDERDITLFRTRVGDLTPLIEWRGGFWFARRIAPLAGRRLDLKLRKAMKVRARARVIHIHHRGAFPRRNEFDNFLQEQAVRKAWQIIAELQRPGGPSFDKLAREHCNDKKARARGGLLQTRDPVTKKPTEWIRWGDRNFNQPMLEVILEKGTPGKVWPAPVISGQGVDVVFVLERRTD